MAEEETVFSSRVRYNGIFSFKDFYEFCYTWLRNDTNLTTFSEDKYSEKLAGEAKNIDVEWTGHRDITDYFRIRMKVKFVIKGMTQVKVKKGGAEVDSNKGDIEVQVKGMLVKDYNSKFEMSAFKKFLRAFYEKYIILSVVKEFKGRIVQECDEFLTQAKAFLDLEGKR
ncbi:MAG TPA: hypothetical protein VMC07_00495 [Candidatus Omnitrophota bacterium]|nr:hypothetical protein [Candidatus Omnitrophota bacterium]